jgi:chemotaxis response regulator CheB
MPKEAIKLGAASAVVPLPEIAPAVLSKFAALTQQKETKVKKIVSRAV